LSALAREAAVGALKACTGDTRPVVTSAHFEAAFSHVFPSVSPHEEANYLRAAERLRNARAKTGANTGARAKAEANGMGAAAPAAGGKHADGADGHGAAEGVPSGARGSGGLFGGAPAAAGGGLFGGAPTPHSATPPSAPSGGLSGGAAAPAPASGAT
jgi:hypothetical protein